MGAPTRRRRQSAEGVSATGLFVHVSTPVRPAPHVVDPLEVCIAEIPGARTYAFRLPAGADRDQGTPPSILRIDPVQKLEASDARNSAAPTISWGSPTRCNVMAGTALGDRVGVPGLGDVGAKRPGHDRVDPDGRAEGRGERLGQVVRAPPWPRRRARRRRSAGRRASDETLMIDPPPPPAIRAPKRGARRNGPLRLTAITLSKSSSLTLDEARTAATCRRCSRGRRRGRALVV